MAEWNHIVDRYSNILVLLREGKWPRLLEGEVGDGFYPSLFIILARPDDILPVGDNALFIVQ